MYLLEITGGRGKAAAQIINCKTCRQAENQLEYEDSKMNTIISFLNTNINRSKLPFNEKVFVFTPFNDEIFSADPV
jgi:hypothetical protein